LSRAEPAPTGAVLGQTRGLGAPDPQHWPRRTRRKSSKVAKRCLSCTAGNSHRPASLRAVCVVPTLPMGHEPWRHPREGGDPVRFTWIPAFPGMTRRFSELSATQWFMESRQFHRKLRGDLEPAHAAGRSPMCRAAAHRGSFASPPGERCAHFGLRKAVLVRTTEIQ
jgi:hypothetical protein